MKFRRNLLFLFVCLTLCSIGMYADALRVKGKSGPYEARLIACYKCEKPKPPYHKEVKDVTFELYNTSTKTNLVRGNGTLLNSYRDIMAKVKQYNWVNGKWSLNTVHNSDRCTGFLGILFYVIKLKYDPEDCSLRPGHYIIQDVDANTLQHAIRSTSQYGREMWKVEVFTRTGTLFCYEFDTMIVPA